MNPIDNFILLNSLSKVGPITSKRLLEHFKGNVAGIFNAGNNELSKINGVGSKIIASIKNPKNEEWLLSEIKKINKRNISFLIQTELPELLLEIYDPPIGLYVDGNIPKLPFVAIVGTRNPTMYGERQARLMATQLTQAGFCVVSGMARGIDTAAHEGALEAGGPTVAVLGSGIDIVYPPENLGLYRRIVKNGAVVSEFPFGRKPDRITFPMRNRIVSGMSQAVLVIESAASGGSLITSQLAADQGRTVFAVPGRIDQPSSAGCHKIIREGATLVRGVSDIIEDLRPYMNDTQDILNFESNKNTISESKTVNYQLSRIESSILNHLKEGDQLSVDELCGALSLSISEVMSAITLLELNKYLRKNPNGKFESL
jgi:DNA processing protein